MLAIGAAHDAPVMACIDARRGEAFAAVHGAGGDVIAPPTVVGPAQLADLARETATGLAVGDGALRYAEPLRAAGVEIAPGDSPAHHISAVVLCKLACAAPAQPRADVLPQYLRVPDAEIARSARDRP